MKAHSIEDKRLGEELVNRGIITATQLNTAREYRKAIGGRLKEVVVKLGFVSPEILLPILVEVELGSEEVRRPSRAVGDGFGERLAKQIADPVVAALARALLRSDAVSASVWQEELHRAQSR